MRVKGAGGDGEGVAGEGDRVVAVGGQCPLADRIIAYLLAGQGASLQPARERRSGPRRRCRSNGSRWQYKRRRVGGAVDLGLGVRRDGERRRGDRQGAGGVCGGEGPVAGIRISDRVGRVGNGEAGGSKVMEKAPPEPMVADCSTPSSVTATVSPAGTCEPLASVPEMVALEVP